MNFPPAAYGLIDIELEKRADAEEEDHKPEQEVEVIPPPPHPAWTAAKSIGGMGVGMLAGYGGMKAVDAILQKTRGQGLPQGSNLMWAVPLVTGAGGLAYSHLQNRTLEKMRQDHLARQEMKRGGKST